MLCQSYDQEPLAIMLHALGLAGLGVQVGYDGPQQIEPAGQELEPTVWPRDAREAPPDEDRACANLAVSTPSRTSEHLPSCASLIGQLSLIHI